MKITWLASYPRSGNTYLRTILFNCFGIKTASIYPNDLGGNKILENFVGHIEHNQNKTITFQKGSIPIIKTHKLNQDENRSIYIIRDGRAASVSLWNFYGKKIPIKDIILGNHRFGTWKDHLISWNPLKRPNTLLIKYEDILCNFEYVLNSIETFLEIKVLSKKLPSRDTVALFDGRWVRSKTDWKEKISGEELNLFNKINYPVLKEFGYE
tara:strand:+ start:116 stop:748 length:633 start_codon:yes stop_codon:yes gene_type:complete